MVAYEEPQRNYGDPLLSHFADHVTNLLAVEQQLAILCGLMLRELVSSALVLSNVRVNKPHFTVTLLGKRLCDVDSTLTDRFDLRAAQHKSSLDSLKDVVLASRSAIYRYWACRFTVFNRHNGSSLSTPGSISIRFRSRSPAAVSPRPAECPQRHDAQTGESGRNRSPHQG